PGSYFNGYIDDVRVWNTARTVSQLDANSTIELIGNEGGLVGYWKLNNNYSDITSSGHTLTAGNSPTFSTNIPFYVGGSGTLTTFGYAGTGYANPHAPTGINNGNGTTTLSYDNNGNLLTYATTSYAYDYRNRITQTIATSTATSTFVYDTNNDRVKQTVGS